MGVMAGSQCGFHEVQALGDCRQAGVAVVADELHDALTQHIMREGAEEPQVICHQGCMFLTCVTGEMEEEALDECLAF